ncbi:MAG: hypothetical protein PF505_14745 [Vallitaleaceae bacterium]|jgi:chromosome segregation ATPase|nr:hypothetical protein [Vallitaleaceae bacterium]
MSNEKSEYMHLLVLDYEWHRIFDQFKTRSIRITEKKLNQLIKEQSRSIENLKGYQQVKKDLMGVIQDGMSEAMSDGGVRKKLDRAKGQIEDVNKRIEKLINRLGVLPKVIADVNQALLDESMAIYYKKIKCSKKELELLDIEINKLRETIKSKMVRKTETEEKYEELYQYIHDLIGSDRIDAYDKKYLND